MQIWTQTKRAGKKHIQTEFKLLFGKQSDVGSYLNYLRFRILISRILHHFFRACCCQTFQFCNLHWSNGFNSSIKMSTHLWYTIIWVIRFVVTTNRCDRDATTGIWIFSRDWKRATKLFGECVTYESHHFFCQWLFKRMTLKMFGTVRFFLWKCASQRLDICWWTKLNFINVQNMFFAWAFGQ